MFEWNDVRRSTFDVRRSTFDDWHSSHVTRSQVTSHKSQATDTDEVSDNGVNSRRCVCKYSLLLCKYRFPGANEVGFGFLSSSFVRCVRSFFTTSVVRRHCLFVQQFERTNSALH